MFPLKPYNDFIPQSNWNVFYYFKNVQLDENKHGSVSFYNYR